MARLPVLALVGRPNVGKSTLFNRLTRSRAALVADVPGLTRDRQYGRGRSGERAFIVIDSGGFEPVAKSGIAAEMARQTRQAVLESDTVVFVVDGREGLTAHDMEIARELRRTAQRVFVAVNKTEGMPRAQVAAEFHELGLGDPLPISAAHGDGVRDLVEIAFEHMGDAGMPEPQPEGEGFESGEGGEGGETAPGAEGAAGPEEPRRVRVAVVGRPNAGKSTLINTLLGEERLIAFDQPGTTRDSVAIEFERGGKPYTLIDTAGLRRRGKVTDMVEKFSVVKTLQSIEDSNVCVLLLDATEQVSDQDATIASYILEAGRALVVAVNKWDLADAETRERLRGELDRKLHFLRFAKLLHLSALKGTGIGALMRAIDEAYAAATARLSTPKLTRALQEAVDKQAPPKRGPFRPKMRYAHQGGRNPPIIVIHGSGLDNIGDTYRRYLEGWFRDRFKLQGTPLRIEFRSSANPYVAQAR
ncbi:ribosome biogenesis GTPase Der [Burkholderiaceae bacterium FT117]|uniref:ribosome biogenesis GTPase Der n=1 Tax=Zeimonas sediminis TaxID=2944268 RepID=UPI0023430497|nr:ribosome biogenesis GTPase Der [Zeimonas sediminis]MCM5571930.1 ribosome biogenesis GTPase Der [Zeimonas sediminis]